MSYWFSAMPLQTPYTSRKPPGNVGSRKQGAKPDTITVCNFQIKRRRPDPYVSVVIETANFLSRKFPNLVIGRNLFPNRLPQRMADDANVCLLVDSVVNLPPRSYIGAAADHEFPRVQLIGVSHDEEHFIDAELLVGLAYAQLAVTFNQQVG